MNYSILTYPKKAGELLTVKEIKDGHKFIINTKPLQKDYILTLTEEEILLQYPHNTIIIHHNPPVTYHKTRTDTRKQTITINTKTKCHK